MAKKTPSRPTPIRKPTAAAAISTSRKTKPVHAEPVAKKQPPPRPASDAAKSDTRTSEEAMLSRAEADIASAIDGLNRQMNSAMATLTELASAHSERGRAVVRTAPLDRATATFQRLVTEVVEEHFSEMLPPLVALRNEMAQRAADPGGNGDDFTQRAAETLDHVFALAGVQSYEPRPGERFDPLIHLGVGEMRREDLGDGCVGDVLQPGFRTARGKVIVPARVRVNRR